MRGSGKNRCRNRRESILVHSGRNDCYSSGLGRCFRRHDISSSNGACKVLTKDLSCIGPHCPCNHIQRYLNCTALDLLCRTDMPTHKGGMWMGKWSMRGSPGRTSMARPTEQWHGVASLSKPRENAELRGARWTFCARFRVPSSATKQDNSEKPVGVNYALLAPNVVSQNW